MSSQLRLPYSKLSAEAFEKLVQMSGILENGPLGKALIQLVFLRVSQINGCSFCLAMHSRELRETGAPQAKLDTLPGWRLSPHFTDAERAALAWAESVSAISETHAPDDVYLPLKEHFTDVQISDLTLAIALMNSFNRIAIAMKL